MSAQTFLIVESTLNISPLPITLKHFWNSTASQHHSFHPHIKHWVTSPYTAKLLSAGERRNRTFGEPEFFPVLNLGTKAFQQGRTPRNLPFCKCNLYSLVSACCSLWYHHAIFLPLANPHTSQQVKPRASPDFPSCGLLCIKQPKDAWEDSLCHLPMFRYHAFPDICQKLSSDLKKTSSVDEWTNFFTPKLC